MVKSIDLSIWKCPLCCSFFWKESDAEECLRECMDNGEEVSEETRTRFVCEPCEKKFKEEEDAIECEQEHIRNQDLQFFKWQSRLEKARMLQVASHPDQKKIDEVLLLCR